MISSFCQDKNNKVGNGPRCFAGFPTVSSVMPVPDTLSPSAHLVAQALRTLSKGAQVLIPIEAIAAEAAVDEEVVCASLPELNKALLALWHVDDRKRPDLVMAYELLLAGDTGPAVLGLDAIGGAPRQLPRDADVHEGIFLTEALAAHET